MMWQNIVLIVISSVYALGTLIQLIVLNKVKKEYLGFWGIVLTYPVALVIGIIILPIVWVFNNYNVEGNPIPKMRTYTLTEENRSYYGVKLKSLGFREYAHRVSKDNIPYKGYVFDKPGSYMKRDVWVVIALDTSEKDTVLRVSIYRNNKYTKVLDYQLNQLFNTSN